MAVLRAAALATLVASSAADLKRPQQGSPLKGTGFLTNAEETQAFEWTPTTRTVQETLDLTFPKKAGWTDGCFTEGGCHIQQVMTQERVAQWVEVELLRGPDPFKDHGVGRVPVPWPAQNDTGDQLGEGQYVGYSRRQVCFIVAKSVLGAETVGYANGLARILNKTVAHCGPPAPSVKRPQGYEPSALTGEFGITLWSLLSACAADPTLKSGRQGPMLLVAKGKARAEVDEVRAAAVDAQLRDAKLSVCRYDDGDAGPVESDAFDTMSPNLCTPPTNGAPGKDFMTGGQNRVKGQAVQDISAKFLGGYVFGNACGLGGGQDERLMTYFPEVFALTFFLSQDEQHPQLREPAWILGARMMMVGLDGTARHDHRLELDAAVPMDSDLMKFKVGGKQVQVSSSTPFLAFMSENQDFLEESLYWEGKRSFEDMEENMLLARQNRHPLQRAADADTWFSFMYQVRAWYSAVALTSYSEEVQPALKGMVRSLGSGPFMAGLWFGDSQLGFLAVWIAHAIAAKSWGLTGLPLQYYIYADFTENPGNQCFVHSGDACRECLARCAADPLPDSAYWLPDYAFFGKGANASCVLDSTQFCGENSFEDVANRYSQSTAAELWSDVEMTLMEFGNDTDTQVFDLLLIESEVV